MKRFLLRAIIALLPCLLLYVYYRISISTKPKGDLSRLSYVEFNYEEPVPAPTDTLGTCFFLTQAELVQSRQKGIVVFGDSFSMENTKTYWQQYLGGFHGCTIHSVSYHRNNPFKEYLRILQNEPKCLSDTVIIETVERNLIINLCKIEFMQQLDLEIDAVSKNKKNNDNMQTVGGFIKARLMRLPTKCLVTSLCDTFFSVNPNTLYYYCDDTISNAGKEELAVKNLLKIDSLSHANGIQLMVVVMPNKLSLYSPYITDSRSITHSVIESPSVFDSINCIVNPLPALRALTDKRVKDVYFPDDTHTSAIGGKAVARYVASRFKTTDTLTHVNSNRIQ